MIQKPIIIGPYDEGRANYWLWEMLHARTGVPHRFYTDAFERDNLPHDKANARIRAGAIIVALWGTQRTVVLLGQDVRRAFGIPDLLVHPQDFGGCTWRQLPYPAEHCAWYADPEHRKVAEMLMEELYREYHRQREIV